MAVKDEVKVSINLSWCDLGPDRPSPAIIPDITHNISLTTL